MSNVLEMVRKGTDSEENANASKDRLRVREGLKLASECASADTSPVPMTHQASPISKSRGNRAENIH